MRLRAGIQEGGQYFVQIQDCNDDDGKKCEFKAFPKDWKCCTIAYVTLILCFYYVWSGDSLYGSEWGRI